MSIHLAQSDFNMLIQAIFSFNYFKTLLAIKGVKVIQGGGGNSVNQTFAVSIWFSRDPEAEEENDAADVTFAALYTLVSSNVVRNNA